MVLGLCADSWMLGTKEGYVVKGVQLELLSFCIFCVVTCSQMFEADTTIITSLVHFWSEADATYRTTGIPDFSKFLGPQKKLSRGSPRESMVSDSNFIISKPSLIFKTSDQFGISQPDKG